MRGATSAAGGTSESPGSGVSLTQAQGLEEFLHRSQTLRRTVVEVLDQAGAGPEAHTTSRA
eukprot:4270108-Prorocentrum_lima.AAC.1